MMTEREIQKALHRRYCLIDKNFVAMVPNCYTLLENECDVLGLRRSMLTDEFEIKVTKSDFLVDAKKRVRFKSEGAYSPWILKTEAYSKGLMPTNYFWYVAPIGLIDLSEIPNYAGFLEVFDGGIIKTTKQAPKTRKDKMPEKDIIKHLCKASVKYWSLASI